MDLDLSIPLARRDDLVVTESGDELLVYNLESDHLHHLNPIAAAVWQRCDGHHSVRRLIIETGATSDAIAVALGLLREANLLTGPADFDQPRPGVTRRRLVRTAATASAALVPVVVSVSAPRQPWRIVSVLIFPIALTRTILAGSLAVNVGGADSYRLVSDLIQ